jgi:group I intron endonuclease
MDYNKKAIYCILNRLDNSCYIGSTNKFRNRILRHILELKKGKHHSVYLQNAWNKYGGNEFNFIILERIYGDYEYLLSREQYYMDLINPEYNMCKYAGTIRGFKHTPKAREKISKALKGRKKPKEAYEEKYKKKRGKIIEHLRHRIKKIKQYDLNGNLIKIWDSMNSITRECNISQSLLSRNCNMIEYDGISRMAGGYIWCFDTYSKTVNPYKIPQKNTSNIYSLIEKNKKPVIQYSLDGKFINKYNSIRDASRITTIDRTTISGICTNKIKKPKQYIFKFYNDENNNYKDLKGNKQ